MFNFHIVRLRMSAIRRRHLVTRLLTFHTLLLRESSPMVPPISVRIKYIGVVAQLNQDKSHNLFQSLAPSIEVMLTELCL
jgi:hypothetical protein